MLIFWASMLFFPHISEVFFDCKLTSAWSNKRLGWCNIDIIHNLSSSIDGVWLLQFSISFIWSINVYLIREIHPLDPQPHRYCMLASTASAPRVTRCSMGLYRSRDLCSKHALAGWGMSSFLGQIVRGSEIWWFMTSAHSLSTSLRPHTVFLEVIVNISWLKH